MTPHPPATDAGARPTPQRRVVVIGVLVSALALAASTTGCQVVGAALDTLPKPPIPAVYEPVDATTVVFVDDPGERIPSIPMLGMIADRVGVDLAAEGVIGEFIPPRVLDEVRLNERDFRTCPIDRVGRRVGAKQVIYVSVETFGVGTPGHMERPIAAARVKVIDVETGQRLFPSDDRHGYAVTTQFFYKNLETEGQGAQALIQRKLADKLAEDVAKLFYEHPERPIGSDFPE